MTFRWWNLNILGLKPHPALVCITLLCELIDIAAIMPMLPDLATAFFDGSLSFTSLINGIFNALAAFISLVCVPVIGSYSDTLGRQRFLLLSILIFNLHIWALSFELNLWVYYATQAFSGISAFGLSNAYVTDIVPQEKRGAWFGIIAVSLYASLLVGALPGLFFGHAWVFRLCGIVALVNVLYVWLFLPESIDERDKLPQTAETPSHVPGPTLLEQPLLNSADPRSESPLLPMASEAISTAVPSARGEISPTSVNSDENDPLHVSETQDETTDPSLGAPKLRRQSTFRHGHHNPWITMKFAFRTPYMTCLSLQVVFSSLGEFGLLMSVSLYMSQVLHFSTKDLSYLTIILALSSVVFMVGLYLPLSKRFGERMVVIVSLVVSLVRSALFCFAREKWMVYALQCLSGCILMSFPAQATLLAKNTIASEQGLGQGAFAGLRQLASGLGPLIFSLVFSYFVSDRAFVYFPQVIYVVAGVFALISLFFAIRLPERDETVHGSASADNIASKDGGSNAPSSGVAPVTSAADDRVLQEILSSHTQILPLSE